MAVIWSHSCAITNDGSCSAINKHERIFKSQVRSNIPVTISAVAVSPGKRLVFQSARTVVLYPASLSWRNLPLVALTSRPTLTCWTLLLQNSLFLFPKMVITPFRTVVLNLFFYQCVSVCRRRRSGQNDGAEDEGGGGEEEDKRDRGADVFGGNQRAGLRNCSSLPIMHLALLCSPMIPNSAWNSGNENGGKTSGTPGRETSALLTAEESASRRGEKTQERAEVLRGILDFWSPSPLFFVLTCRIENVVTIIFSLPALPF